MAAFKLAPTGSRAEIKERGEWTNYGSIYDFQIGDDSRIKIVTGDGHDLDLVPIRSLKESVIGREVSLKCERRLGKTVYVMKFLKSGEEKVLHGDVVKNGLVVVSQNGKITDNFVGCFGIISGGMKIGEGFTLDTRFGYEEEVFLAKLKEISGINISPDNITSQVVELLRGAVKQDIIKAVDEDYEDSRKSYEQNPLIHGSVYAKGDVDVMDPAVKITYLILGWQKEANDTDTLRIGEKEFLRQVGLLKTYVRSAIEERRGLAKIVEFEVGFPNKEGTTNRYKVYGLYAVYDESINIFSVQKVDDPRVVQAVQVEQEGEYYQRKKGRSGNRSLTDKIKAVWRRFTS